MVYPMVWWSNKKVFDRFRKLFDVFGVNPELIDQVQSPAEQNHGRMEPQQDQRCAHDHHECERAGPSLPQCGGQKTNGLKPINITGTKKMILICWVHPKRKETEKLYFAELWWVMWVAHQKRCSWVTLCAQYRAKSMAKKQKINDHQVAGIFQGTIFQQNKATPKVKALINALIPTFTSPIVEAAKKSFLS